MSKGNKVPVSGRIEPELLAAVDRFCQSHHQTRSDVLARGLRWIVTPEFREERERVVAETLDRIFLRLSRHDHRVQRELHVLSEMLALFVRAYYNHTPRIPEPARDEFRASGKERFEAFMEALAEHVGPGKSMLEQVPAWERVRKEDIAEIPAPPEENANAV